MTRSFLADAFAAVGPFLAKQPAWSKGHSSVVFAGRFADSPQAAPPAPAKRPRRKRP